MDQRRKGNVGYDIKHVSDHQMEMARLLALGRPVHEICDQVGVVPQTVSNFRNHPIGRALIKAHHGERDVQANDISKQIAEVAPEAIALMREVIAFRKDKEHNFAEVPGIADQVRASAVIVKTIAPRMNLHKHVVTEDLIKKIKKRAFEGGDVEEANFVEVKIEEE